MLILFSIVITAVFTTIAIHYITLRLSFHWMSRKSWTAQVLFAVVISMIFLAHCLEVVVFGMGHYATVELAGLGTIEGQFNGDFREYVYFSFVSYTSLGLGDIYPHGSVRLLTGIEALTGLIMIGWSASFTYILMNRSWDVSKE